MATELVRGYVILYRVIVLLLSIVSLMQISFDAYSLSQREYQIKSAFIANFIRYTRWQPPPTDRFQFCTTSTLTSNIVSQSLNDQRWFNLTTEFSIVAPGEEGQCHFLFIDQHSHPQWQSYLAQVSLVNVLIVSEKKHSASRYSQINFFFVDNKLRFEINPYHLNNANLKVDASLLRLARIVESEPLSQEVKQ